MLSLLQLILVGIVIILLTSVIRASIRPSNFPKGPLSFPIVGCIPFLDIRNLGKSFSKLSRRYGDIFSVYIGTTPCVVLNSWPLIKEAYSKPEFAGRPKIFSGTFFQKGKVGVCTTEGEVWKVQRTFFHDHLSELVKGKGAKGFEEVIMDEIHDLKMELSKKVGEPVPMSYRLNVAIINILLTIASGRRLHAQQQEFQTVYECIDKITQFMSKAAIMSFMPILARILPEAITKMERGRYYRNRFVQISEKWISEHKQEYRGNRSGDLQDAYLAKMKEGASEHYTEQNLGAMLREMFVIGAETESVMLRWAIRILSVHKDVQRKIQNEIDEKVTTEDVAWDDRHKLHYTMAALAEIQRYADITPTGLGHKTTCDVQFHGYYLPKDTIVIGNLSECHRNPNFWKYPDQFCPEHFLDCEGKFTKDREGFLPFGTGIRRCPGEDVANMEMFLLLTNILKHFTLSKKDGDSGEIGTQYKSGTGVIRNPKPYYVVLHNRD